MLTNREFARTNDQFIKACEVVSEKDGKIFAPTKRQASKYRKGEGRAYTEGRQAVKGGS